MDTDKMINISNAILYHYLNTKYKTKGKSSLTFSANSFLFTAIYQQFVHNNVRQTNFVVKLSFKKQYSPIIY